MVNAEKGKRNSTFKQILEIHGKSDYWYYPNVDDLVDAYARGENILEMAIPMNGQEALKQAA